VNAAPLEPVDPATVVEVVGVAAALLDPPPQAVASTATAARGRTRRSKGRIAAGYGRAPPAKERRFFVTLNSRHRSA
jgi:hypothetical protein